jgi:ATP-dependent Lon protease
MNELETKNDMLISLPVLSVRGTVAFPAVPMSLDMIRPLSLKALAAASKGDGRILLLTQKDSTLVLKNTSHLAEPMEWLWKVKTQSKQCVQSSKDSELLFHQFQMIQKLT